MPVNPDFRDLFAALNGAGARYLLVGGYAVAFHALIVHRAPDNVTARSARTGYSLRFTGPDVRYRESPGTNRHLFNPALAPGDPLDSEQFPVAYLASERG